MYYLLIVVSVILFGGNFLATDIYRQERGNSLKISMEFSLIGTIVGLPVLLLINGLRFECTPFSLLMAMISVANGYAFTFCAFKALGKINLSLYSLFSMLGGMVLPFFQGILFFDEKLTTAKIICVILITVSLILTIEKGERKKGTIYYIGIFIFNGMSGVLSKIFVAAPYEKVSSAGFSILSSVCGLVITFIILLVLSRKKDESDKKITPKSIGVGAISGVTNKIANFVLLIALSHVDASVQYPMVTGGVMIVSTLICFFGERKPSKKEIMSVVIAFLGLLLLFVIPE